MTPSQWGCPLQALNRDEIGSVAAAINVLTLTFDIN
jgi:hypothetical protein